MPMASVSTEREHAEDTVFWSIKPATTFAARRRTVYLFHNGSGSLSGKANPLVWVDNTPKVWTDLRNVLELYNPLTIALNIDPDLAFADGMHAGELERLSEQLGEMWMSRIVRRPLLAVELVARRIPEQLEYYKKLQEMAWAMVSEAFSEKTIIPGITTTDVRILALICRDPFQLPSLSRMSPGGSETRCRPVTYRPGTCLAYPFIGSRSCQSRIPSKKATCCTLTLASRS
jgi:hypothetical protein